MIAKILAFLEAIGEARYQYQRKLGYRTWY
jgi:hypothetical protein